MSGDAASRRAVTGDPTPDVVGVRGPSKTAGKRHTLGHPGRPIRLEHSEGTSRQEEHGHGLSPCERVRCDVEAGDEGLAGQGAIGKEPIGGCRHRESQGHQVGGEVGRVENGIAGAEVVKVDESEGEVVATNT